MSSDKMLASKSLNSKFITPSLSDGIIENNYVTRSTNLCIDGLIGLKWKHKSAVIEKSPTHKRVSIMYVTATEEKVYS